MKLLPILPLALAAIFTMPQANAADIKQDNINACINNTVKYKIANKSDAAKLCHCTIEVRSKMTIGQMWEIESYTQDQKDISNLPYIKKMYEEGQQCQKGLDIKLPQQPT